MMQISIGVGFGNHYTNPLYKEKEGEYGEGRLQEMIDITLRNINHVLLYPVRVCLSCGIILIFSIMRDAK